ncbi:phytanoyl-dioxygenase family protein [Grosmannia clavigera kw1407]|uniref:Phytanoyl-dioxygenase family protein n=1 Tax=Grosmannia clavigera (strain kw1407 / UAMH 11150) TaxID=655863 RepID=F0XB51_GROCL|nr:phytanoyl-dioxygenase family protein [Grosmannia clavigera kw1407]EFX04932.1 phytanoyl-dioxygenase family protein [Grosmannia clavigera kw1407]
MSQTIVAPVQALTITAEPELSAVPEVPVFNNATATVDEVIQGLIMAGGVVIKNAVTAEDLAAIEKDTRPFLDADTEWNGEFFPKETRRVNGLAEKSAVFMNSIVRNKLYQEVCKTLLSSSHRSWLGDEQITSVSTPQLNNTIIFSIGPGARAQGLHRDDMIHHNVTHSMEPKDYKIGQDTGIGFFVGAKKTTKQNGATRFIPGSHLWDTDRRPQESQAVFAELNPGDGFIMLASCLHGGSANTTTDEERLVYSCFMTKGFLRQEENQYINNSREKLKTLYAEDMNMLKLIGYDLSAPFLGWVEGGHPLRKLYPEYAGNEDMY